MAEPFHQSEDPGPSDPEHLMHRTYASKLAIWLLAAYGVGVFMLLVWSILTELPGVLATQEAATPPTVEGTAAEQPAKDLEAGLLKLVLCFGATGGLVHLFSSLGRFVGGRQLQRSWLLFYYLRPFVGAVLGLFTYLILRMGVLSPGSATSVNVYGVLTFAALAGMFSRQAIDKFAEVFEMLFQKTKEGIGERDSQQLFADAGRDDVSVPLSPGPPPMESFKDEEPTKG